MSLDCPEYMRIPVELIPQEFVDANKLASKIKNGYIYMKITQVIYGLPQAGVLANKLLKTDSRNMIITKLITQQAFSHTIIDQYGLH